MFPVQSDGLVFEGIPSFSDHEQDKNLEDLLAECAALEADEHKHEKGVKKRQRKASSLAGNQENNDKSRKSMHRDIEKQRRQEMAGLYASLRSLLPLEYIKGKRAVTDQLHQAANYISHMQKKIGTMQMRRDKLKKLYRVDSEETNKTTNIISDSRNCVKVNSCSDGMEILISSVSWPLSKVFADLLGRSELNVISCVSTRARDGCFLHKIQIKVSDPTSTDINELQQRLANVIN